MSEKRPACVARQQSDQKRCERCDLTWDMNDPDPPACLTTKQVGRKALAAMRKEFPPQDADLLAACQRYVAANTIHRAREAEKHLRYVLASADRAYGEAVKAAAQRQLEKVTY